MELNSETRFALNSLIDVFFIFDTSTGEILFANQSASKVLGYEEKDWSALNLRDIYPFEIKKMENFFEDAERKNEIVFCDLDCVTRSGKQIEALWSARVRVEDGRRLAWVTIRQEDTGNLQAGSFSLQLEQGLDIIPIALPGDYSLNRKMISLSKFPEENPGPVIRVSLGGVVLYGNRATRPLLAHWGIEEGDKLPERFNPFIRKAISSSETVLTEFTMINRTFQMVFCRIEGENYINIYGQDITLLKNTERELKKSKEIAERANRSKSEFLSRMSHELRTPMNAILGFTQLLQFNSDKNLNDTQMESLDRISSAGQHLLELINEILDLSTIESGNLNLAMELTNIVPILDNVIAISRPLAENKGIALNYDEVPSGVHFVEVDPLRLKQVLLNLISNAIKYNKPQGSVTLSLHNPSPGEVRIGVTDTGNGIPEDKRKSLFKPFERFDPMAEQIEGTGIGLTISKQMIELMNGSIGFNSEPGKGSCFYIDLPLTHEGSIVDSVQEVEVPSAEKSPVSDMKVLYIDDTPTNVKLVERIFSSSSNMKLVSASNAIEGIELAMKEAPQLILMDIQMPEMDGLEAFGKLQENEKTRDIPVIALTANAMSDDIQRALDMGFKSYITKPIEVSNFLKTLSNVLA